MDHYDLLVPDQGLVKIIYPSCLSMLRIRLYNQFNLEYSLNNEAQILELL